MKITTSQLRRIIQEEVSKALSESSNISIESVIRGSLNSEQQKFFDTLSAMDVDQLASQYSDISKEMSDAGRRSMVPAGTSKEDIIKMILDTAYPDLGIYGGHEPVEKPESFNDLLRRRLGGKLNLGGKSMAEAMSRITPDEVAAWKNGNWAYVSGDEVEDDLHKMDMSMMAGEDPERFLHGKDPHDDEGSMVKSRLYSMKQMAKDVCDILNPADQLPGWVQDHISVAHENLQQVHGYLMGQQHATERGMMESKRKQTLSEVHNRITKEEMDAWMRGDWGFVSEDSDKED